MLKETVGRKRNAVCVYAYFNFPVAHVVYPIA